MEYFGHTQLSFVLFSILSVSACSNSGDEPNTEQALDSRSTISTFLQNKPEDINISFTADINENIKSSANLASISFTNYAMNNLSNNSVVVTWPMLSTLPLITAATHDDTYDEVMLGLSDFGLEQSWSTAIGALHHNLSVLGESGTTLFSHHFWWQQGSRFESEFLTQIDSALSPEYIYNNFKIGESISEEVDNSVINSFGTDYSFTLEKYADTRLVALNQMKTTGAFDAENIQLEAFDGLFLEHDNLIRTPMLRLQGTLGYYENSDFSSHKIPMADGKLSLISIQPKIEMRSYVLENMNTILNELNNNWVSQETSAVLPVTSVEFEIQDENWFEWKDIDLIYSEEQADLRSMDHLGSLYMQSMPYLNRITISEEGVQLAGVTGHAVTFDESNLFFSPNPGAGLVLSWELQEPTLIECSEADEDLVPGFVVIMDEANGIIQAILSVLSADGTIVGVRC